MKMEWACPTPPSVSRSGIGDAAVATATARNMRRTPFQAPIGPREHSRPPVWFRRVAVVQQASPQTRQGGEKQSGPLSAPRLLRCGNLARLDTGKRDRRRQPIDGGLEPLIAQARAEVRHRMRLREGYNPRVQDDWRVDSRSAENTRAAWLHRKVESQRVSLWEPGRADQRLVSLSHAMRARNTGPPSK